jgi:hypothetical protein
MTQRPTLKETIALGGKTVCQGYSFHHLRLAAGPREKMAEVYEQMAKVPFPFVTVDRQKG